MEIQDVIQLRGHLRVVLGDLKGNPVEEYNFHNLVVTAGRRWVLQQLQSVNHNTAQNLSHIAVGTSTTAPATGDSAMGSESTRVAINSFDTSGLTSSTPYWQAQVSYATNQGNTTLGEVGMFNSSSGGTLFARATFATIDKTTSNTLSISYTISN